MTFDSRDDALLVTITETWLQCSVFAGVEAGVQSAQPIKGTHQELNGVQLKLSTEVSSLSKAGMLKVNCFCCSIIISTMAKRLRRMTNQDEAFMSVYANITKNDHLLKLTNLNIKDSTGWSLMHRAVIQDDRDTLLFLCNTGMSTGIIANDVTPLQLAIERGNLHALCILLQYGCSEQILNNGCSSSSSPLQLALKSRFDCQYEMIKRLLQFGCDVNKADFYLESSGMPTMPLSCAIRCRSYELTQLLLDHGAKITVSIDSEVISFFIDAILVSSKEMVQLFIQKGADVNHPQKSSRVIHRWRLSEMTPVQAALMAHDTEIMRILLQHNANPNFGLKQRAFYGFLACHAPVCMAAKKPLLGDHLKILLSANCALNWPPEAHRSASTVPHSCPLIFVDSPLAIKLLLIFGCRPSSAEERDRFRESVDIHVESGSDFGEWLKYYYFNPPTLLHLTRIKIRESVGLNLKEKLKMLILPKKLQDCILMENCLLTESE
ncbi:hypothetical protein CAPTEDRAFT_205461 [Capitella teleta]|uniref:SOCS box domain-containing protein n=1 Tax=Capitella teleta TaxID=283909 RepID=R7UN84_CAPTE|nr:hypothetical protein CAPTEDRAFT_205461 [Capitella teleta]|eukprot:ELU05407.1 hypothetical protein CAPTEDRAFT_205461 [Capitella teleta]